MHSKLVLLSCLASAAVASASLFARQDTTGDVPDCAMICASTVDFGNCDVTDSACLCANENFINSLSACISGACAAGDLAAATQVLEAACVEEGVDPSLVPTPEPPAGPTAGVDPNDPSGTGPDPADPTSTVSNGNDPEAPGSDGGNTPGGSSGSGSGSGPGSGSDSNDGSGSNPGSGAGTADDSEEDPSSALRIAGGVAVALFAAGASSVLATL